MASCRWTCRCGSQPLSEALRASVNLGLGTPLVSRSFKQSEEGGYEVTLHFDGLEDEAKEDQTTFEFDVSMSEDPIEAHPNFDAISEKYGWDEGFPAVEVFVDADGDGACFDGACAGLFPRGLLICRSRMVFHATFMQVNLFDVSR